MLLLFAAVPAHADEVQLRGQMVVAAAPSLVGPAQRGSQWTWLTLREPRALAAMPADWLLQTDQVRFERVRVIAVADNGAVQDIALGAHQLEANWAAGGVMQFGIAAPGRSIRQLSIGFERLDDPGLFRKVTAMDPATAASHQVRWLLLMGLFAGLLIASFAYKLLFTTRRLAFRRWYLGWVAASLAYGLIWSNVAAYLVPGLAGPPAIRAAYILVSLTVTLGSLFLLSVLEDGKVPPRLRSAVKAIALVCVALGVVAANETWMAAGTSDLLFNLALVACVGVSFAAIVLAALRGSRVVWLYLAGWSPVIAVFAARAARNFGLMAQSDAIDMATFVAIALESLVFSVVVLDRFHTLRKERDAAEASARGMEIERQTLRRAAHSDFLTGLGNRASFHEELRVLFDTPAAARGAFTLYLIDIDYLKDVNDRHGHDGGDALLRQVGRSLAALTDGRTSCARIGGDEFAVLCCHDAGMERPLAREIERLQGQTWAHDTRSGTVSLSVGSATARSARSPAELFRQADIALYEAKRLGRGCHQPFDERLRRQVENDRELIDDAHAGLGRGEFVLYYQPIVALRDRRRVGVEALLRWNHPRRGLLGPNAFAGVLADREIGSAVQRRVLKLAIEELRRWPADAGTLGVNLTSLDLSGAAAAHKVLRQLAAAGVPPAALCVEVTEGTILDKPGDPGAALQALHDAGVRIALDDFGTGYASLVHLKEIPVDTLKIDRSFIAGLMRPGDESEEIVRAVLALGHGLNKTVIAEGVETPVQLERLRELGCDFAQGYLFGRPAPAIARADSLQAAA